MIPSASRFLLRQAALVGLAWVATVAHAAAQYVNPHWIEHGSKPVFIQQTGGAGGQELKFINFKDGMLVAELEGGVGEISLPVSESMVRTLRLDTSGMQQVNRMIAQGNYVGALVPLRPIAYPLVKFHEVPKTFTQLHAPIRALIDSLIAAGELEEARDLIGRIQLGKVEVKYSESALRLLDAFLAAEEFDAVAALTRKLPVDGPYAVNIRPIVDAADSLRAAGQYEAVIPLYREILDVVPEDVQKNVQMWLAYSLVLANRLDEAAPIIEALEEPEPGKRLFSLYKLLEGSREHRRERYSRALDLLTRGFVRAQTSYAWVPEMLYLIGDCYSRIEDFPAARSVWTEVVILYPDSPWFGRAKSSLAELPKPQDNPAP